MEQRDSASWRLKLALLTLSLLFWRVALTQIRYSVLEEQKDGTLIGNIAKDLGLDRRILKERGFRVVSTTGESLFTLNQNDGILYTTGKIDREEICERSSSCLINLKIALEHPIEIHNVEVEVVDINDHAPMFPERAQRLEISENAVSGSRFQIQAARDPDSGINSVQMYKISHNEHFRIDVKDRGSDRKMPFLILQKLLDRETSLSHKVLLTAVDGGKPPKSGTMEITIDVLDINDNIPVFTKDSYSVKISENVPIGTTIAQVNATDRDDGVNGEVFFTFGHDVDSDLRQLFDLDPVTGEIIVKGQIDFEQKDHYEIDIQASDKALAPLTADKSILIQIIDVNDNAPEIEVTSFLNTVPEDSKLGTTVALISVSDLDSGLNRKVSCSILEEIPFRLMQTSQHNIYSLTTAALLDREKISQYDITLVAQDAGQPALSSFRSITVQISDVNDNSPKFSLNPHNFYITENNVPGTTMFSVSASDCDLDENAMITYQILRDISEQNKYTSFVNINSENGQVYALKSFDFETVKAFHFQVLATDSGNPSLSSNGTVNVFILDQNDNVPVILYPVSANGSADGVEEVPRNVNPGHLVTKVRAYDADIGYNGWLLFSLQEVSDHSLFGLDRYTGQIRTLRSFTETDEAEHKLVILVKDNGNVSLSATATVTVKLVEPKEPTAISNVKNAVKDEGENNIRFYLIITLGSVSILFIISIIILIAMQCSKSTDYSSKHLQDTAYDGTLCHSIQYRSGDKRYTLVGSRMSIGSTIVPSSNRNTLLVPDHRRRPSREVRFCSK
ncbi:protocadherin alpha-8 [Clarias gariepinus]|uniref:protocadherin alpha-8 n=1 Tax=Clarias gariepinus TaxID=13013 RepID=UPI00234D1147|nr:protocadherin alpha-8 [Clarias gariepinus]